MTSHDFFAAKNAPAFLGRPVDLAFLAGSHLFESLLRGFIATEAACHPGSLILLHDCVLLNTRTALRQPRPGDSGEGGTATGRRRSGKLGLTASRPLYAEPDRLTELFTRAHQVPGWHQ